MTDLFGTEYPIVQAPMAGISTPALAAAVSNAGGLGSLGIGASTVEDAKQAIADTKLLTDRPFNVNVFCHQSAHRNPAGEAQWLSHLSPLFAEFEAGAPERLDEIYNSFIDDDTAFRMLLEVRPAVISFHFGLPSADKIAAFRNAGVTMLATATSLSETRAIEAAGIDGIVAQGIEAGGHRGIFDLSATDERLSTSLLVRLLVKRTRLPVIAAGGIMDGAGIRSMLDLGAVAAQLGTAFLLCPESATNKEYRENLRSERAQATRLTSVLSGRPARGIVNRFIETCEVQGAPLPPDYPVAYDAAKQLNAVANSKANSEFAAHWAGQGAPLIRELSAAQLVETLALEIEAGR